MSREIDVETLKLRSRDVDMHRRLRTSELFKLLQEASIRHTEALGMGRDKTLDKGILWVLLMQRAEIVRMPEYDERVVLKSWPGKTMHLLFPRFYSMETAEGEPLLKASALWSLVDEKTRKVVFPEKYGVVIEGAPTGEEIAMPGAVAKEDCVCERDFSVPYSFVDLNGHMNNTRYFDVARACIGGEAEGLTLRNIRAAYLNEALLGDRLSVSYARRGNLWTFEGKKNGEPCFQISLEYES